MFSCLSFVFFIIIVMIFIIIASPRRGRIETACRLHVQAPRGHAGGTRKLRNPWRETCGCRMADAETPAAAGPGSRGCPWLSREPQLKREPRSGAAGERQAAGAAPGGSGMWGARAFLGHVSRMLVGHRVPGRALGILSASFLEGTNPLSRGLLWEFGEVVMHQGLNRCLERAGAAANSLHRTLLQFFNKGFVVRIFCQR